MMQSKPKRRFNTRPLTRSEKILLSLLALVLLVWGSNRFLFQPQDDKLADLELEKTDYEMQIIEINETLKSEEKIKQEKDILEKEREEILAQYFPTLDQSQIIYLLNDLTKGEDFSSENLSFTRPATEKMGEMDVKNMQVSIPFDGNYEGVVNVLNSINYSPKRILVDNLSMNRDDTSALSGDMSLKIYSLEGIAETDPNVIYIEPVDDTVAGVPFEAYDDFSSGGAAGDSSDDGVYDEDGELIISPDDKEGYRRELLHGFDYRNYTFIPSSIRVDGNATPSSISKSGKYSMRLEYNILAVEDENRAYVDLRSSNIDIKIPPDSIGAWVYSFGYSPGTLGMRLTSQTGEIIDEKMVEGISWMGWNYVETTLPADLSLYPLSLDYLYFEVPKNRDDYGVLLIDKMEAFYRINEIETTSETQESFVFYVVQAGDTVIDISRRVYGTANYKNEIMKMNEISPDDVLSVGKVLVLKRR